MMVSIISGAAGLDGIMWCGVAALCATLRAHRYNVMNKLTVNVNDDALMRNELNSFL